MEIKGFQPFSAESGEILPLIQPIVKEIQTFSTGWRSTVLSFAGSVRRGSPR